MTNARPPHTPKCEAAAAREDAQETHPSHSKKSLM